MGGAKMLDPLDAIAATGYRVVWVNDLGSSVLILDDHRLALADADLTRAEVAERLLEALRPSRRDAQP